MSQFYSQSTPQGGSNAYPAQNLQFYPSSYGNAVSGHSTPAQAQYGGYGGTGSGSGGGGGSSVTNQAAAGQAYPGYGAPSGFMSSGAGFAAQDVSGRMGDQGGLRTGWLAAFGTEGYDGEPPLLEELGVNFDHIKVKTLTVLNPLARVDQHIMDDSDLFGPILFCLLFGTCLLLSGKVHFGYIYGLAAVGSVSLHNIFKLMSNPQLDTASSLSSSSSAVGVHHSPEYNPGMGGMGMSHHDHHDGLVSTLTFFRSCSVLGYCLLPLVLISFLGVAVPMDTVWGYLLTSAAVAWCTYSSSGMFCAVGRMTSMRPLVAYPLMLFYVGFGLMGIFSSRGSGAAARAGL